MRFRPYIAGHGFIGEGGTGGETEGETGEIVTRKDTVVTTDYYHHYCFYDHRADDVIILFIISSNETAAITSLSR